MAAIACVEQIKGPQPPQFDAPSDDAGRFGIAEVARRAGWFDTAERLAGGISDLNRRAYVLLKLARAIRDAGDPGRALTIARSLLAFKGRIERAAYGEALALTVRLTASQDPGRAAGELVSGLVDGFDPDLFGLAQELTPRTIDVLAEDLGLSSTGDRS